MARRKSRRKRLKLVFSPGKLFTLFGIGCFVASAMILVAYFVPRPPFNTIREYVTRYLGWADLVMPFIIAGVGLIPFQKKRSRRETIDLLLGSILGIIAFLALSSSFVPDRSGILGQTLWTVVQQKLTSVGAVTIYFIIGAIGVRVFFDTPFSQIYQELNHWWQSIQPLFSGLVSRISMPQIGGDTVDLPAQDRPIKITGSTQQTETPAPKKKPTEKPAKQETSTESDDDLGSKAVQNLPLDSGIWQPPPRTILNEQQDKPADRGDIRENAAVIERTLDSFGISAKVVEVNLGPAVTQYALEIAMGTKLSKITSLSNDLALALAAPTGQIRIEAPIPGRSLVGIEIPNRSLEIVSLKRVLNSDMLEKNSSKLAFGLGLDVSGSPVVAGLAKMPHMLIAGATGSGKSVSVNAIISTYLFRASPQELRLILVDPKRVELVAYNGIPHLLTPVIVEVEQALAALKWAISEMDRRYKLFAGAGARNIDSFNEISGFQALPYLVIVIDELADLMTFAPAEFEDAITRLAQMARATGIHLILSTQRPSTDVITGLIKANIPARIAFAVSSLVDSRVILDTPGAEKLLGRGDMLFLSPERAKPVRIQGTFVSDQEIRKLVGHLKEADTEVEYSSEVTEKFAGASGGSSQIIDPAEERDELFEDAVQLVCQADRASASLLQRRLRVGYARAARILDQLEAAGIVSPPDGSKPRDVLVRDVEEALEQAQAAAESA